MESIGYYLLIVVDTESKRKSMGIIYLIVGDTESKRNLPGLFIKFMYTKKNY